MPGRSNSFAKRFGAKRIQAVESLAGQEIARVLKTSKERLLHAQQQEIMAHQVLAREINSFLNGTNHSMQSIVDARRRLILIRENAKAKTKSVQNISQKEYYRNEFIHADLAVATFDSLIRNLELLGQKLPNPTVHVKNERALPQEFAQNKRTLLEGVFPNIWENRLTKQKGLSEERVEKMFNAQWERHELNWRSKTLTEREKELLEFIMRMSKGEKDIHLTYTEEEAINTYANSIRENQQIDRKKYLPIIERVFVRARIFDQIRYNKHPF
jgi:hypothetical protein